MYNISHEKIANIPSLHIAKQDLWEEKLPLIIFIHGFTSAKENNLHFAYLLAQNGFRVILPEVKGHGERTNSEIPKLYLYFWDLVVNTIDELDLIRKELINRQIVDECRIGLAGVSMGAIVTFGALKQYDWIKAAVSLMGCPAYVQYLQAQLTHLKEQNISLPFTTSELEEKIGSLQQYDITLAPDRLQKRPLLIWHGEVDNTVPHHFVYEFYNIVKKEQYINYSEHIKFISDPNAGHKVTREGILETIKWFKNFI
ncbi:alpha/beta fold hydrolase [Bacillus sp. Marseille-P3661]|uniref:alpha/beta fold hydrolase n=1 Tax=Bacillus sp. Marseille-P3661 TaxID=1936234 RepID=UPI000C83BBF8|nr:alpha/beta fold hydrolase [Bacillus sp. Marseille-P3661]